MATGLAFTALHMIIIALEDIVVVRRMLLRFTHVVIASAVTAAVAYVDIRNVFKMLMEHFHHVLGLQLSVVVYVYIEIIQQFMI